VIALRTADGRYLGWDDRPRGRIVARARSLGAREQFGLIRLDFRRVALRATNGFLLSTRSGDEGEIFADVTRLDDALTFEPSGPVTGAVVLRADGHAMTYEPGGDVHWHPDSGGRAAGFTFTIRDLLDGSPPAPPRDGTAVDAISGCDPAGKRK
jgi:hypothetical protein